jgi:hypothetical protein
MVLLHGDADADPSKSGNSISTHTDGENSRSLPIVRFVPIPI